MLFLIIFGTVFIGFAVLALVASLTDAKEQQQKMEAWLQGYRAIFSKYGSANAPWAKYELSKYPVAPNIDPGRMSDEFRDCASYHSYILLRNFVFRLEIRRLMDEYMKERKYSEYNHYL